MSLDELVDGGLIGRIHLLELQAHADAAVAPRDARLDVHLSAARGQAEPDASGGAGLEWAGGADRDAAATQVQRERGGDGVPEPVGDRDPEDDTRAAAAIEAVWEQMR